MAAYRQVHDSRRLQAGCQKPGSAPEPTLGKSSMGGWASFSFYITNTRGLVMQWLGL